MKQGLDGKPNLNLGKRGRVEVIADENVAAKLAPMSAVTEKLAKIFQGAAVHGGGMRGQHGAEV